MRRGQPGFTLVELLVAIAVMALLAIVSWRGLDGMVRAQQITRERADAVLELQTVLAQWGADLDALQAIEHTEPLAWDGQALRLTRRGMRQPRVACVGAPGAGLRLTDRVGAARPTTLAARLAHQIVTR